MEINVIALNVGNSRLAIGTFIAGELGEVVHIAHSERSQWRDAIATAWGRIKDRENAAIVGASVHPAMEQALEDAVLAAANRRVVWVGRDLKLPIKVLTDAPEKTGVDRVVNVAAAYELMESACVVIDAGTAITIDCCNDAGEFLGGAIAPGARLQFEALHEKTAALPEIGIEQLAPPSEPFGSNTADAIVQGVFHGIRGMVKELLENYATALGRWPDAIATGGDAAALFSGWELIHAVSPNLTLYGIVLAYTQHQENEAAGDE